MNSSRPNVSTTTLPDGYVAKTEGTVAPDDLIWNPATEAFESSDADGPAVGRPVDNVAGVATPAHWVTYDATTGIVWGVGDTPEASIQAAKFGAYGEDHAGVGHEFSCWCAELKTKVCSETLHAKAREGDRLSLSDEKIREHVIDR